MMYPCNYSGDSMHDSNPIKIFREAFLHSLLSLGSYQPL